MPELIVFRLYGPLAAWGDIAVGEERPTTPHPSKTAVLGLVAAALGIARSDESRHRALHARFGFAVRVDSIGVPLRDFHTTQKPASVARLKHLRSRRDELADPGNLGTVLSTRDYRSDACYTPCLHVRETDDEIRPETIIAALRHPVFPLYLGRRSCPLALPTRPQLITAETMEAAWDQYDTDERTGPVADFLNKTKITTDAQSGSGDMRYYWETDIPTQFKPMQSVPRHDRLVSRTRWQFAARMEHTGGETEV